VKIFDDLKPHLNKFVIHSIFICEKVMRKFYNIKGSVIHEKGFFETILFQRISFWISSQLYFQWGWKILCCHQPRRESLTTKFSTVYVMVSIEYYIDSVCFSLPYYFFELLKIGIVVLKSFRFEALPRYKQSEWIDAPVFKIIEVFSNERVIWIVLISPRKIRKLLVYNI